MAESKLTKAAIIENLHETHGFNRSDIHMIIDEFFEEVKKGLKNDQVIELRGLGRLKYAPGRTGEGTQSKDRRNRCGRDPWCRHFPTRQGTERLRLEPQGYEIS